MKKTLLIFMLSFLSLNLFAQKDEFIFFNDTYKALQTRAVNSNRPYFVYFYANWCMDCKKMNDETFTNSYFIKYAEENYLGMKVDGESLITDGKMLADKYNVLYYPTVIIFSPYGKELKRIIGNQSPSELIKQLGIYAKNQEKPTQAEIDSLNQPKYEAEEGEFLFKMSAKSVPQDGYGVQVGVFSSYRNAFLKLLELEEKYYHKNILVHIKEEESKSAFKIILGPFLTEETAKTYKKHLFEKQKMEGIVVELDDLN